MLPGFWRAEPEGFELLPNPPLGIPQAGLEALALGHDRTDRDPADACDLDLQRLDDPERAACVVGRSAVDAHALERTSASGTAARVTLSDEARWIAGVADEMRRSPEVRLDVVERTREALLDGSFDNGVDMDALIDRLARAL